MGQCNVTGPNEAIVVSGGCCNNERTTVIGGWIWSWWFCSDVSVITLETLTINPCCDNVETSEGVPLNVTGVAQCKVLSNHDFLMAALEQFLSKSLPDIKFTLLNTLEGHLRSILGSLTVEQVYSDRFEFAKLVKKFAAPDLARMGFEILSFTIRDIADGVGYLASLGRAQIAVVIKDADIAKAEAERDAAIREAECKKQKLDTVYKVDTVVADYSREFEFKQAAFNMEVSTAQAESELAYDLQTAKTKQEIIKEEVQIDVVERRKQVDVEEKEILRKEKELVATVRKAAEAEGYKLEKLAQGDRYKVIAAASGAAEGVRLVGDAEASKIVNVGKADAQYLRLRAEAFKHYGNAAISSLILKKLPQIAAEISQPMTKIDEIVILGDDKTTGEVSRLISNLPPAVQALTGQNIAQFLTQTKPTQDQK